MNENDQTRYGGLAGLTQHVTVVICTRNRGSAALGTVESVLANKYPTVEILVVDQSTDQRTETALLPLISSGNVRYLRTSTVGLSRARNVSLFETRSEFLLFTDDDCVVEPGWIQACVAGLSQPRSPVIVFGDVVPAPDCSGGYAPQSIAASDFVIDSIRSWKAPDGVNVGIGASMAVRRSAIIALGGFDEFLGAGAELVSAEDIDVSLRAVLSGYSIVRTKTASVVHYGSRDHQDFRKLTRGAMFGVGAVSGKLLKYRPLDVFVFVIRLYWCAVLRPLLSHIVRGKKPPVLGRAIHLSKGLCRGLMLPVDPLTLRFRIPTRPVLRSRVLGSGHDT